MSIQGTSRTAASVLAMDPYQSRTYGAYQDYWNNMEQDLASRGTDWAQLIAANPYKNITRKQGLLSKIGSFFGLRTSYDKFLEQQQMNSNEYLANLAQKAYQEDFESPAAEAQRMQQAGLNPDLLGTEGVNGAGQMPEETGIDPSAFEEGSDIQTLQNVGSFMASAVSMAFGFVKDFSAMQSARQAVKSGNLDLASDISDLSMKTLTRFIGENRLLKDPDKGWIDAYGESIDNNYGLGVGKQLGLRGRQRRIFASNFMMNLHSLEGSDKIYDQLSDSADKKTKYVRTAGSRFFDSDIGLMTKLNESLQDMADDIQELNKESQHVRASGEVIESRNFVASEAEKESQNLPAGAVELESLETTNKAYKEKVNKIVNEHMNSLMNWLEKVNKEDPTTWSEALFYAFSIMRLTQTLNAGDAVSGAGKAVGKLLDVFL